MFKIKHISVLALLLLVVHSYAQQKAPILLKKKEPENKFALAFGANLSSVNIYRNYKENPYRLGFDARAYYEVNSGLRVMAEYCFTKKFDLNPTWYNVKNNVFNVSVNAMAYIKDQEVMVYTISGLCIQRWKGFYTGQQDFSSAQFYYQANTEVLNKNLGLDLGLGFERPFPGFYLYGDFRYRFANVDNSFGITDAAYNLGIKFPIFKEDVKKSNKHKHKKVKGSDKYHWF
jgi:Outer membrane protein beta-barrel domain